LYIPKIKRAFTVKRTILSALLALIIPAAWMAKRFTFDGTKLFEALFLGEVADRVSEADQNVLYPLMTFFSSHIFIILVVLVALSVLLLVFSNKKDKADDKGTMKAFIGDIYLYVIWAAIPVAVFSASKSFNDWYVYTSLIAVCALSARLADFCITDVCSEKLFAQILVGVSSVVLSLLFIVPTIKIDINLAGTGGHPVDQFTRDAIEFKELWGEEYSGFNAYLICDFRIDEDVEGHWEPEYVAPAEMYMDVIPVDGTVDHFLNDPDSILVLDKRRWEEFAPILTGHVILEDNSYLIFSHDMY
jgi:heme/copper-type cytochrome/quinol oxidase subunit 2